MDWVILLASGVLEAVWATALGASDGLRKWKPTLVFVVASVLSLYGLGVAMVTAALAVAFAAGWRLLAARPRAGGGLPFGSPGTGDDVLSANRGMLLNGAAVWPVALGLLACLAATVAHGLIDNSLFLPDLMGWFVSASGIFWLYSVGRED